jgi:hypothetical protein
MRARPPRCGARAHAGNVSFGAKWGRKGCNLASDNDIWSAAYHVVIDDAGSLTQAIAACEEVNALAAFDHPAQRRLVGISLPMLEAFEAGLFFSWITPSEVVRVPRPSISIVDDHLHREDGPAVEWETDERYWFWRGTSVPQWVIEESSRITSAAQAFMLVVLFCETSANTLNKRAQVILHVPILVSRYTYALDRRIDGHVACVQNVHVIMSEKIV